MKRKSPDRTDTDKELWHKVASTVTPLNKRAKAIPKPPDGMDIYIPPTPPAAPRLRQPLKQLVPTHTTDIDGALLGRLRSGELPIAGRIDLHGMTRAEAEAAITRFIHFSYHNGRRCVLIITGRSGVLKPATVHWLNEETLRPFILAIAPARKHGGEGAFYVLLKRRK